MVLEKKKTFLNVSGHKTHTKYVATRLLTRRTCHKVERLWKSTNMEVYRLHLKELIVSLNEMIKQARSRYFSNLVSQNKRNPKVVFDIIQNIVSPSTPLVPVFTTDDCNKF